MSTENIISMEPIPGGGLAVTFSVHGGEGSRTYYYSGPDAVDIMAGADPAGYSGSSEPPSNAIGQGVIDTAVRIAIDEIGGLL